MSQIITVNEILLPHLRCELELGFQQGELIILTGENGIGKSTLLRHLESLKGKHIVHCQQKGLEIFFNRRLGKLKEILFDSSDSIDKQLWDKYWKLSGLIEKEDRPLSELSGGEGQLLKILIHGSARGEIYLLDEPGQYLDKKNKKIVSDLIGELLQRKKSVLIVEHDWSWIEGTKSTVVKIVLDGNTLRRAE